MPTYEYECTKCGHRFEVFHAMTEKPRKRCPECRGTLRRLIGGGAGMLFKGSGFYATDYRSKAYKDQKKEESGEKPKPKDEAKGASTPPEGASKRQEGASTPSEGASKSRKPKAAP